MDASQLSLQIMDNSNPEAITVELRGTTLGFDTVDDDVNGETRHPAASDGEQYSDQTVTIRINPINDAPRIDMTDIEQFSLKSNKQMVINIKSRMTDVDAPSSKHSSLSAVGTGRCTFCIHDGNMILSSKRWANKR